MTYNNHPITPSPELIEDPYTYACDYIRSFGPVSREGVVLSRSDASQIRKGIAKALEMDDVVLAQKLADAQLANEADPEHMQRQTEQLLTALGYTQ